MRSKLFVPGSRPELFAKALASDADGISFDLEDAVAETAKAEAREKLQAFLEALPTQSKTVVVRINGQDTAHYPADLAALANCPVDIINLPKAEDPQQIRELAEYLMGWPRKVRILANIESPQGLRLAAKIATAHPLVMGLQLGFADLFEPLGIDRGDDVAVRQVQLAVRLAAGEAGIDTYDAAFSGIKDPAGFEREAIHAKALGFTGKSCIHPSQVALANQAFMPSAAQIEKAQRILVSAQEAQHAGIGAWTLDGQMIDAPFVERARLIVAQARNAGLLAP